MKAIRVHQPGPSSVLKLESGVPIPEPSSTQVLVRVKAVGINPVDVYIRSGGFPGHDTYPYTPGFDCAGTIEKVGADVKDHKVGDRVYVWGFSAYAELTAVEAGRVFSLPDNATFEQGAAIGVPYFSAYRSLVTKAHLKAGQTVLIHGASGGVGVAALQTAKDLGAKVVGTASSPEGLKLIEQYGTAFNHRKEGYEKEIASAFPRIDIILEMLGNVNISKDLDLIGQGGTIVIIGNRGTAKDVELGKVMMKECKIEGMILFASSPAEAHEMGAYVTAGLKKGALSPLISEKFPLEKAADAHDKIMADTKTPGKIVLIV